MNLDIQKNIKMILVYRMRLKIRTSSQKPHYSESPTDAFENEEQINKEIR